MTKEQKTILDAIKNQGLENTEKQFFSDQDPLTREGRNARRIFALLVRDESGKWFFK